MKIYKKSLGNAIFFGGSVRIQSQNRKSLGQKYLTEENEFENRPQTHRTFLEFLQNEQKNLQNEKKIFRMRKKSSE
jgi:excinuclease UvrABC ATPase subunit